MQLASISTLNTSDFKTITEISDICFGKNYLTTSQLNKTIADEELFFKIEVETKIIGFCLAHILNSDKKNIDFDIIELQNEPIAVIKTIAIHPSYQRMGYGTLLLEHVITQINTVKKVSSIYYPSWIEPKSEGFSKSLIKQGFSEFKLFKKFWLTDSLQNNYSCLICGKPPCNCSMRLFRKN